MTDTNQKQLGNTLWKIADDLRFGWCQAKWPFPSRQFLDRNERQRLGSPRSLPSYLMKPSLSPRSIVIVFAMSCGFCAANAEPPAPNPDATVISDAVGDADPQVKVAGYDFKSVTITKKGSDRIVLSYECAGDIPDTVDSYTMFCAKLDLDRNAATGQSGKFGMGSEINVRIFMQPNMHGWTSAVDKVSPVAAPVDFDVKELEVKKNRATIVIQSKFFRNLKSFDFGVFCEAKARPSDSVPETGFVTVMLK
jgi:hypothetical protein